MFRRDHVAYCVLRSNRAYKSSANSLKCLPSRASGLDFVVGHRASRRAITRISSTARVRNAPARFLSLRSPQLYHHDLDKTPRLVDVAASADGYVVGE